jgi:dihydrofolate reductase
MKNLIIIAAIGQNRELGRAGDLVWRIKEDLAFFRAATTGHIIVMGRKTYESMPKNLPGRRYVVISRGMSPVAGTEAQGAVTVFNSVAHFLSFAKQCNEDIYIVGGGAIYAELLPYADTLILTEIMDSAPDADTFFPKFDMADFTVARGGVIVDPATHIKYRRNVYTRR